MSAQNDTPSTSATSTQWGFDNGLTDPAIASPFPNEANYFSEPGTDPNKPHWTVAIESENAPGVSAPGPACQSFPVTDITQAPTSDPGVATIQTTPCTAPDGSQGIAVNLKTDLYHHAQPAGPGYFTWYAFGENVDLGGGTLPPPATAEFDVNLLYDPWLPNAGARADVTWQAWWDNQSYEIDIDLDRQGLDWGANSGTLVQNVQTRTGLTFVQLNGAALGLSLIPGVLTQVHIDWGSIFQTLVANGVIQGPAGGWSTAVSQAAYVSTELTDHSASGSGIASLTASGFSVSSGSGTDASTTTAVGGATMFNLRSDSSGSVLTDCLTGNIIQSLPPIAAGTMQFIAIDGLRFGTNLGSAESLGLDPTQLRDYDGNALGPNGVWEMKGLATVRPGAAPSYILFNPITGRWAEVAEQSDGTFNFHDHGQNGSTRIVGIYRDPLIAAGVVVAGSSYDSQTRFLADVQADHLNLLGSLFDQQNGGMDLMFKLNNTGSAPADAVYLRAILFLDGNIQYANYMNATQFTQWLRNAEIPHKVYDAWLTST